MNRKAIKVNKDGFVWRIVSKKEAQFIWEHQLMELYVLYDDDSEGLIESKDALEQALQDSFVGIEVGHLTGSESDYLLNLQEISTQTVLRITDLLDCSRQEAFKIIQDWTSEFGDIYGPYQYTENNDYYELLDHFIEEKFELLAKKYNSVASSDIEHERSVWLRAGIVLSGTKQEIDAIVSGDGDIKALLDKQQFEFQGDSYIPECSVEEYNRQYNTDFNVNEISYNL